MLHRVGALELVTDVGPAAWIVERLHPFAQDVGSVVPEGFEAYVRVFHPAYLSALDGSRVPVRWCEIAIANGRIVHPEMQFPGITGLPGITPHSQPGVWDEQPEEGSMPLDLANRLAAILAVHTGTPKSCWFAIWEGFGDLRIPRDAAPRFSIPCRDLFLLRGPVEAIAESLSEIEGGSGDLVWLEEDLPSVEMPGWNYRSANLWWPEDRAWCVATEIDFEWTYVGGTAACVQEVLTDSTLEALPARLEDGITWASDRRNPCPPG